MGGKGSGNKWGKGKVGNKGGGRKPSLQPKGCQIAIRLDDIQMQWVFDKSQQAGKSPSTWIRDVLDGLRANENQK